MDSGWTWDVTLFAGAAPHYERGRVRYPPSLAATMQSALHLTGTGRLLDVGCGPGTVVLRVAHLFADAVGLDPDPGMLLEAERLAHERGVTNARFVRARAEDLPAGLGTFSVVTFAQSFHWLDRALVASTVRAMLEPGGVLVHVDNHRPATGPAPAMPHPDPPIDAITALVRDYLGPDRRAGQSIRGTSPSGEDEILRAAGYTGPSVVPVPDVAVVTRSVDDLVAETLSTSSSAPHLFENRLEQFVTDLRGVLNDASPTGRFSVRPPEVELKIWRA